MKLFFIVAAGILVGVYFVSKVKGAVKQSVSPGGSTDTATEDSLAGPYSASIVSNGPDMGTDLVTNAQQGTVGMSSMKM